MSFVITGDSGYPLEPFLLTPVLGEELSPQEKLYNAAHNHARNVVERCFGVLKARFRCLLRLRTLHYNPTRAAEIVNACAVLHNICKLYGLPDPPPEPVEDVPVDNYTAPPRQGVLEGVNMRNQGVAVRQSVMQYLTQQQHV